MENFLDLFLSIVIVGITPFAIYYLYREKEENREDELKYYTYCQMLDRDPKMFIDMIEESRKKNK